MPRTSDDLALAAQRHLLLHYSQQLPPEPARPLLVLERGDGPWVWDTRGRKYIDGLSSLYCAQLGYSYGEEMAAVASAQLRTLPFGTTWSAAHRPAIELAERLAELAPGGLANVFFTSGGSESVEAAWKIAREYHLARGEPQRRKAIARHAAYHGMTLGALALTGVEAMKEDLGDPAIPVRHVSDTNAFRAAEGADPAAFAKRLLDEVEAAIVEEGPETVSMLIAEPVQNAGGSLVPPPGYWAGLRRLCDRHGILLVADEVITGCGRIGKWFASGREGVAPDLIALAKGLTSAHLPMGAVLVADSVIAPLRRGKRLLRHGYTFGGHPVAAAVAARNLEIFARDGVLENVNQLEPYLERRMRELLSLPIVGDVRGAGFFWSAELVRDGSAARLSFEQRELLLRSFLPKRLLAAGVIAKCDDRGEPVVQIAPPLISTETTLDAIVERLHEALLDASRLLDRGATELDELEVT